MYTYTANDIETMLSENGKIAYAILNALRDDSSPLLIEGDPGVGKTSLAKAVSAMLNIPLIRVSCQPRPEAAGHRLRGRKLRNRRW